jgi:hypothetical protein
MSLPPTSREFFTRRVYDPADIWIKLRVPGNESCNPVHLPVSRLQATPQAPGHWESAAVIVVGLPTPPAHRVWKPTIPGTPPL